MAARLAIAGHTVLLLDAGDDEWDSLYQQIPALQLQSTEYVGQSWDYFVNHYTNLTRQEEDTKMSTSGFLKVFFPFFFWGKGVEYGGLLEKIRSQYL